MKTCHKCYSSKSPDEFHKDKSRSDGLSDRCKLCVKEYQAANRTAIMAQQCANWASKDTKEIERIKAIDKERNRRKYALNGAKIRERTNAYYKANCDDPEYHEHRLEYNRQYYKEHQEERAEYQRQYRVEHPEVYAEQVRRDRARRYGLTDSFTEQEWVSLKKSFGCHCLSCGRQEPEIRLTRDHVVPLVEGGSDTIDNIQPLCGPCNSHKGTKTADYRLSIGRMVE